MKQGLFKTIDNSPLIIFRIIFGLLICLECWGAIATGWVQRILVAPQFTFNFIHLDFLQPLPGYGMYAYFVVLGTLGICIMLGYRYVLSCFLFCVLWGSVYLMQKSAYNNHYYLLWILSIIMCVLPANTSASLDVKQGRTKQSNTMPNWCRFIIIAQLAIVYTFASIAKLYPDWLNTTVAKQLMSGKAHYFLIGGLLQKAWVPYVVTYVGILFDLLIIPALLFKQTRKAAFIISIFFHLYNSFVLQIGIFPYLALGFSVFFFPAEKIRQWFRLKKINEANIIATNYTISNGTLIFISLWLAIQLALPLRHWFIKGDVLWTEEGHRLSWRMMLRNKTGSNTFYVVEEGCKDRIKIYLKDYLTPKQIRAIGGKPDIIWQFAQHLKKTYANNGQIVEVYVNNFTSVNGAPYKKIINPKVNLASTKWNYFGHNDWILID